VVRTILSIDGGGYKGLLAASFLSHMDKAGALPNVDLVCGTSTGGIIALGYAYRYSFDDMVEFYLKSGPEIFNKRGPRRIRLIAHDRYDEKILERALKKKFGRLPLKAARRHVLIPAIDHSAENLRESAYFFTEESEYSFFDAARATSAAPTYFKPYEKGEHHWLDGGIYMNNAAQDGYARARELWPHDPIRIISVGTGYDPPKKRKIPRLPWLWVDDVIHLAIEGSSGIATRRLNTYSDVDLYRYEFPLSRAVAMDDASIEATNVLLEAAKRGAIKHGFLTE